MEHVFSLIWKVINMVLYVHHVKIFWVLLYYWPSWLDYTTSKKVQCLLLLSCSNQAENSLLNRVSLLNFFDLKPLNTSKWPPNVNSTLLKTPVYLLKNILSNGEDWALRKTHNELDVRCDLSACRTSLCPSPGLAPSPTAPPSYTTPGGDTRHGGSSLTCKFLFVCFPPLIFNYITYRLNKVGSRLEDKSCMSC